MAGEVGEGGEVGQGDLRRTETVAGARAGSAEGGEAGDLTWQSDTQAREAEKPR